MKNLITIILTWIILSGHCQTSSLLWEITGNELPAPSYLYGTMHISDKRIFRFSDSLEYAFKKTTVFAGEMVLDKEAKRTAASEVLMPPGTTLISLIGEENFKKVKKRVRKKLPVFAGMVNRMKPIFTIGLISKEHFKNDRNKMLDEYLQKKAKKQNKNLVGLETVKEQLSALDKISLTEQAQMLMEEINSPTKTINDQAQKLIELYLKQDIEGLLTSFPADSTSDEFNTYIINERNHTMANRMEKLIKSHSSFVAVGAAHLAGSEGIIQLLRNKGYTVRPVYAPFKLKKY